MRQWSAANASLDASIEGNESVRLRCSRHAISVKGVGQDGYGLEVAGGAVLRREVGQESHNAAGARGNFGRHCAAHQAVPPRVRQGGGGHQHGPDGVRGGVGELLPPSFVVHHTQQISMAAVAKSQSSARDGRAEGPRAGSHRAARGRGPPRGPPGGCGSGGWASPSSRSQSESRAGSTRGR